MFPFLDPGPATPAGIWAPLVILMAVVLLATAGWSALGRVFGWDKDEASKTGFVPVRGSGLVESAAAGKAAAEHRDRDPENPPGSPGVRFGPVGLPFSALNTHVLIMGTTESGKSSTLELMVSSEFDIWRQPGRGNMRFVLFDPKCEWPSKLFARLPAGVQLYLTHPLDRRGVAWDLAADFRNPADFQQLAAMLVPESKDDQNRYFTDSARDTVADALLALSHFAPDAWTLRDLIQFCRSPARLKALLGLHPTTRDRVTQVLSARSGRDVVATIGSSLSKFGPVAACWEHATHRLCLRRFMDESAALVLGHHASVSFALQNLNRLMVKRLCDLALDRQTPDNRTVFVFDEFRLFGRSEGLTEVAMRGRSSGASLIVTALDINGLIATHDDKTARELLSLLQHRVFLKAGSIEQARFAAELLGKQEVKQYTTGNSATTNAGAQRPASQSTSTSEQVTQRDVVLPAQLLGLPLADPRQDRLAGYFQSPVTGSFFHEGPFVQELRCLPVASDFPNFVRRDDQQQHLRPLSVTDLGRLNMPKTTKLLEALGPPAVRP